MYADRTSPLWTSGFQLKELHKLCPNSGTGDIGTCSRSRPSIIRRGVLCGTRGRGDLRNKKEADSETRKDKTYVRRTKKDSGISPAEVAVRLILKPTSFVDITACMGKAALAMRLGAG